MTETEALKIVCDAARWEAESLRDVAKNEGGDDYATTSRASDKIYEAIDLLTEGKS